MRSIILKSLCTAAVIVGTTSISQAGVIFWGHDTPESNVSSSASIAPPFALTRSLRGFNATFTHREGRRAHRHIPNSVVLGAR